MVLKDKRDHCFFVCNLRPDFKKVKFDVRRSLEPFKDLDGCFDPSLTALTKRSQTLSNGTCVSRTLSAGVWDRLWPRKGLLLRYTTLLLYTQLCCKSTFLSRRKLSYRECCMLNLLSWSLNEGQLNLSHERNHLTNEYLYSAHCDTLGSKHGYRYCIRTGTPLDVSFDQGKMGKNLV